jgi:ribosome-interacting GTPase 1
LVVSKLDLPTIIVVGVEKSGKSTALNRLASGFYFPRDHHRCTLMSIRLKMVNIPANQMQTCEVTIPAVGASPARTELIDLRTTKDPSLRIGQIMRELPAHENRSFLGHELVITVRSPDVPTLELLDLPGIVEKPSDRDFTKELTMSYMRKPESLVLVVVAMKDETLDTDQTIGMVEELGIHDRSILVMTKWWVGLAICVYRVTCHFICKL